MTGFEIARITRDGVEQRIWRDRTRTSLQPCVWSETGTLIYGLTYSDAEELLPERGVRGDHVTVYLWVRRITPELTDAARPRRHVPGERWFVDETRVC